MARKKGRRGDTPADPIPPARPVQRKLWLVLLPLLTGLLIAWIAWFQLAHAPSSGPAAALVASAASYVGAAACKGCHEAEYKAWQGSHHEQAMQAAGGATVLGNFSNVRFWRYGIETTFFRRDGRFMVRTDGADGKLADFEISHTFGVYPLQQYLVAFPGGRFQTLQIAWDSRPKEAGGQRWFHLQPDEKISHKDPLHWTGIYQNWAMQCAECHSTDLRKGYDATTRTYKTTYAEINVACESCHGQGSHHLEWAGRTKAPYGANEDKGLVRLASNWQSDWKMPSADARSAVRTSPADPAGMNTCAACHARRSTLSEERQAGAPLEDSHRLAMLTPPNYHVDGQQREEVYVWASFLQSKMHQRGVTCMDCHEPHAQKLRAEGNALCTRCHAQASFDSPAHHRHAEGSKGAQCVNCHMPTQNYMVIHARQDHSLRIPRPDLSQTLGSPNACTQCHTERQPAWAASAMDQWYGTAWRARPHFGSVLHAAQSKGLAALPELLALAGDASVPAVVRATAATLAQPLAHPGTLDAARRLSSDPAPGVRIATLGMLDNLDMNSRILVAAPLLADSVRGVRIEAARLLADVPDERLPSDRRAARQTALQEYESALALNADWPAVNVNRGNLRLRQGRGDEAIAAYEQAIALDPNLVAAYVNLADLLRQQQREAEAEKMLRRAVAAQPANADLQHALGLSLVRLGRQGEAFGSLANAARLAPENARYAYVYAVALHSAGKPDAALAVLRAAGKRHPSDLDILNALIAISRERGDGKGALAYAKQAAALLPENQEIGRLVAELQGR